MFLLENVMQNSDEAGYCQSVSYSIQRPGVFLLEDVMQNSDEVGYCQRVSDSDHTRCVFVRKCHGKL